MWTLPLSVSLLSFTIQVVVGVPSFGTGPQLDKWNEADDDSPGVYIPKDFMAPMRNPFPGEDMNQEDESDSSPEQPPTVATPEEITVTPTPRPPTVKDESPSKTNADDSPSEAQQPTEKKQESTDVQQDDPKEPTETQQNVPKESTEVEKKDSSENVNNKNTDSSTQTEPTKVLEKDGVNPPVRKVIVIARLFPQGERSNVQSSPLFRLISQNAKMQMTGDNPRVNGEVPKPIARIVMRLPQPSQPEDRPCDMDIGISRESSSQDQLFPQISRQENKVPTSQPPTIKRVLLKSLVPREYFILKDIVELLKAKAAANANNEAGDSSTISPNVFMMNPKKNSQNLPRFVAMSRPGFPTPRFQLPPLVFPKPDVELPNSDSSEFPFPIKQQLTKDFGGMFGNIKGFKKVIPADPYDFEMPSDLQQFDNGIPLPPQMKEIFKTLLTRLPERQPPPGSTGSNKNFQMPDFESLITANDGHGEDRPIHYRRRQMLMSFDK